MTVQVQVNRVMQKVTRANRVTNRLCSLTHFFLNFKNSIGFQRHQKQPDNLPPESIPGASNARSARIVLNEKGRGAK